MRSKRKISEKLIKISNVEDLDLVFAKKKKTRAMINSK